MLGSSYADGAEDSGVSGVGVVGTGSDGVGADGADGAGAGAGLTGASGAEGASGEKQPAPKRASVASGTSQRGFGTMEVIGMNRWYHGNDAQTKA